MSPQAGQMPVVDPSEAMTLLAGDALMIDVRDQKEWEAGHAPHAIHVPLEQLSDSLGILPRQRRVIAVSRSGRRATTAVSHLRAAGLDAVKLKGGLYAWQDAGGEVVADHDRTPKII